jgi:osmotically-inducible protein OsmY|tara:strand:+ start:1464 stop:1727 length:264 start_codon:yes stop_codon:yes gene_type:complete
MIGDDIGFGGLEDSEDSLVNRLNYELGHSRLFKDRGIECNYVRGIIELTGKVPVEYIKRMAGSLVNGLSGSYGVWNRIEVGSGRGGE